GSTGAESPMETPRHPREFRRPPSVSPSREDIAELEQPNMAAPTRFKSTKHQPCKPAWNQVTVDGKDVSSTGLSHYRLLWARSHERKLTGTKSGCGIGECAVCLVHVDGKPTHSCITTVSQVAGKKVTTIEGLATDGKLTALQQAWIDEQVPQCGWCQSGQLMMAEALLREHPKPTAEDMDHAMFQVLCRCGTYPRIKSAILRASGQATTTKTDRKSAG